MHFTLKPTNKPQAPETIRTCGFCGKPCIGAFRTKKTVVYVHVMHLHHERRMIVDREIIEHCTVTEDQQ